MKSGGGLGKLIWKIRGKDNSRNTDGLRHMLRAQTFTTILLSIWFFKSWENKKLTEQPDEDGSFLPNLEVVEKLCWIEWVFGIGKCNIRKEKWRWWKSKVKKKKEPEKLGRRVSKNMSKQVMRKLRQGKKKQIKFIEPMTPWKLLGWIFDIMENSHVLHLIQAPFELKEVEGF